jgi:hydroxymethylbilane synthase
MAYRLRIGSRPSPLAIVQAEAIRREIEASIDVATEIVPISTTGDKITSASLAQIGGKGLFVRELEQALSDRRIDIAVHSLKDLPAHLPEPFRIVATPKREDPRDALLLRSQTYNGERPWEALAHGARVGTSSARRKYELMGQRPDLQIDPLRGNVETRLRRLAGGEFEAIILAMAGLKRLNKFTALGDIQALALREDFFIPAGGQGALAIEALRNIAIGGASELDNAIAGLDDAGTRAEVTAERGFLGAIGASCVSPVGVKGTFKEGALKVRGIIFSIEGSRHMQDCYEAGLDLSDGVLGSRAQSIGESFGAQMLAAGADVLLDRG